jgi:hypothetical protein
MSDILSQSEHFHIVKAPPLRGNGDVNTFLLSLWNRQNETHEKLNRQFQQYEGVKINDARTITRILTQAGFGGGGFVGANNFYRSDDVAVAAGTNIKIVFSGGPLPDNLYTTYALFYVSISGMTVGTPLAPPKLTEIDGITYDFDSAGRVVYQCLEKA